MTEQTHNQFPVFERDGVKIYLGDCREILPTLPDCSVNCCVTSPPYWGLRDYGHPNQIGLEKTPQQYIDGMVAVFREVRRILRDDGTLWLNLGDSYATGGGAVGRCPGGGEQGERFLRSGMINTQPNRMKLEGFKPKDLIGIPWRVALALQADGWYLRQDIIWSKPNPMPESVLDRCTKSHEYIFLLSKSERYHFDSDGIKEPAVCGANGSEFHTGKTGEHQLGRAQKVRPSKPKGSFNGKTEAMASTGQNAFRAVTETRNKRSVWTVALKPYKGAHFATYPPELIEPCILAGCPAGGVVLDPFSGSGTTASVARRLNCQFVGCELNPDYIELAESRVNQKMIPFNG